MTADQHESYCGKPCAKCGIQMCCPCDGPLLCTFCQSRFDMEMGNWPEVVVTGSWS